MEVGRRFEMIDVAEPTGHALDLLDLAVEPLAHRGLVLEKRIAPRDQEMLLLCFTGRPLHQLRSSAPKSCILPWRFLEGQPQRRVETNLGQGLRAGSAYP